MSRLSALKAERFAAACVVAAGVSVGLSPIPPPGLSGQQGVMTGSVSAAPALAMSGDDPTRCPAGQLPGLKVDRFPASAGEASGTPDRAVAVADPHAGALVEKAFAESEGSPVWVSATDGKTFVVTRLGSGWFASTAAVIGCRDPGSMATRIPRPATDIGEGDRK